MTLPASEGAGLDQFDITYFAASCDDAETMKKYAKALKLDYPVLSDPDQEVAKAYGVVTEERSVPHRWTFFIGKDGTILHIDKEVDAGNHGAQIAAKLEELGIPKQSSE